jgi:hypothetical protein
MMVALLVGLLLAAGTDAQTFYYNEVTKDGCIYVFADVSRYDAFVKDEAPQTGAVITREGYGPNGETVIFDSENAINLYNFKHGRAGEGSDTSREVAKSDYPTGKISGLMFGDYYYYYKWHQDQISSSDPTPVEGQHGLWFRRLYFTYDFSHSETLAARFRLEANSDGEFAGGDLVPYVKDAYIRWTYHGKQRMTLGVHPSLTFGWLDEFWGLRHIEKTPADLYRIDSSRDFGITFEGPAAIEGLNYAVQFGNESGNGSETQEGKILRFEGRYERDTGLSLEGFYSFGTRPAGEHRHTAQGVAGFKKKDVRAGAQYIWQQRQSGEDGVPDQRIDIWSGFVVWDVLPKKADLFLRVDTVQGSAGGVETGLPGAEGIDYWLMSPQSSFTTWIIGGEWYVHPSFRLSPNLERAKYANDPDPVNFPGRDQDSIFRLTFFWTF